MMSFARFKEAAFFFRNHLPGLLLIFLVTTIPLSWLPKIGGPFWQQPLHQLLLETVLGGLASAAGFLYIHHRQSDQPWSPAACYQRALGRFGPIILLALLSNILVLLGLSLLFPGLFLMYCFLFAEIELVLNGQSPLQALTLSAKRALKAHQELLPAFTALLGALWLIELVKLQLQPADSDAGPGLILLFEPVANALLFAYFLPLIYRTYQCSRT